MDTDEIRLIDHVADVEYEHFDEDPDGDPDRAGDGIYFRLPGETSWNGPWHSREEAEEEAVDALAEAQGRVIEAELLATGFVDVAPSPAFGCFVRSDGERFAVINLTEQEVSGLVVGADNSRQRVFRERFDGSERFGATHMAIRSAIESVGRELDPVPSRAM